MKEIIFVPYAGLCNRLNAIMSALALLESEKDVVIRGYWPKDKDCYAKFSDLFKPFQAERFSLSPLINPLWNFASKRNFRIPFYLRKMLGYTQRIGKRGESDENINNWINSNKLYVSAANRFHPAGGGV